MDVKERARRILAPISLKRQEKLSLLSGMRESSHILISFLHLLCKGISKNMVYKNINAAISPKVCAKGIHLAQSAFEFLEMPVIVFTYVMCNLKHPLSCLKK